MQAKRPKGNPKGLPKAMKGKMAIVTRECEAAKASWFKELMKASAEPICVYYSAAIFCHLREIKPVWSENDKRNLSDEDIHEVAHYQMMRYCHYTGREPVADTIVLMDTLREAEATAWEEHEQKRKEREEEERKKRPAAEARSCVDEQGYWRTWAEEDERFDAELDAQLEPLFKATAGQPSMERMRRLIDDFAERHVNGSGIVSLPHRADLAFERFNRRCPEPMPADELRGLVRKISTERSKAGYERREQEIAEAKRRAGEGRAKAALEALGLANRKAPEPREQLVEGVLEKLLMLYLSGPKKCMKTAIALAMLVALRTGKPFLGRFRVPRKLRVVYFTVELKEDQIRRRGDWSGS
jgi:hypothetical protein